MVKDGCRYPPVQAVQRPREDLEVGSVGFVHVDYRRKMAASAEHDGCVRKPQPFFVVNGEVADNVANKGIALAGHHEPDREACRVSLGGNKGEASERTQGSLALEVHIQDDSSISVQEHISKGIDPLHGIMIVVPELPQLRELLADKLAGFVVGPDM